ncbi:hypothetical protein NA57DRAFT_18634, partial [Rhizodiscina lignyota]
CDQCKTTEDPSNPLKNCAKCKSALYCNRGCQKEAWKMHKKVCSGLAAARSQDTADGSSARPPSSSTANTNDRTSRGPLQDNPYGNVQAAFKALDDGTWLDNCPQTDAFKLLVDAYRLRVEDEYKFDGNVDEDSLYGSGDPKIGFRRFLRAAEQVRKPLPSWWSAAKRLECERWAAQQMRAGGGWSDLGCAAEKSDIVDHYGDSMFPMQLRMLAEEIVG